MKISILLIIILTSKIKPTHSRISRLSCFNRAIFITRCFI